MKIEQLFYIDETIGNGLRWKQTSRGGGHKADQPCGYFEPSRQCYITQIQGKIYLNHKIVYALSHNLKYSDIKFRFVHLDGDSTNNSISNIGLLRNHLY